MKGCALNKAPYPIRTKAHSTPQVELVYLYRYWENGNFLVSLQKVPNSSWHVLSLKESDQKLPNCHYSNLVEKCLHALLADLFSTLESFSPLTKHY